MSDTEPLDVFLERLEADPEVIWEVPQEDMVNLFTEAMKRMQAAEGLLAATRLILSEKDL